MDILASEAEMRESDDRILERAEYFLVLLYGNSTPRIVSRKTLEGGREYQPSDLFVVYPVPKTFRLVGHLPRVVLKQSQYTITLEDTRSDRPMPTVPTATDKDDRGSRVLEEADFFLVYLHGNSTPLVVGRQTLEEGRKYQLRDLFVVYALPTNPQQASSLPRVALRRRWRYALALEGSRTGTSPEPKHPEMAEEEED